MQVEALLSPSGGVIVSKMNDEVTVLESESFNVQPTTFTEGVETRGSPTKLIPISDSTAEYSRTEGTTKTASVL